MKKPHILVDSTLVALLVFALIGLLKFNPINFHVFDLKEAWRDFELTDVYFSKIKSRDVHDTSVVIVDIDTLGRRRIAELVSRLSAHDAAVIAVDAYFSEPRDPEADSALREAFKNAGPRLVLAGYFEEQEEGDPAWHTSHEIFGRYTVGHINLVGEHEAGSTIRHFRPTLFDQHALAVEAVKKYDPRKAETILARGENYEIINYLGGIEQFTHLTADEILSEASFASLVKGKIVLLGYAGSIGEKKSIEDAHFTPLNEHIGGRSLPDTYGVVIHANIISMILREDYINKVPTVVNVLLAVVVGMLHVLAYVYFFVRRHKWFHLVAKISQLVTSILLMFVVLLIMGAGLKFEPALTLLVILLSVDVLYFYEPVAPYLGRKLRFRTYFAGHHDH